MVFCKYMFINKQGEIVSSIAELHKGEDFQKFLEENVPIWKKTIQALGYSFVNQNDSLVPIWLKNPLPPEYRDKKVKIFSGVDEYDSDFDSWMEENLLKEDSSIGFSGYHNWAPNFIPEQAIALEKRLMEWGKYKSKDVDYNLGEKEVKGINYSGSEIYKNVYNIGKSEPDIITRSFVHFIDNKNELVRKV